MSWMYTYIWQTETERENRDASVYMHPLVPTKITYTLVEQECTH